MKPEPKTKNRNFFYASFQSISFFHRSTSFRFLLQDVGFPVLEIYVNVIQYILVCLFLSILLNVMLLGESSMLFYSSSLCFKHFFKYCFILWIYYSYPFSLMYFGLFIVLGFINKCVKYCVIINNIDSLMFHILSFESL